ncbi:hypothetical protein B0H12DRAFT_1079914 [Mycena haematopus]|nr:hypothetical protein B0H12DRAFT_1079914 [Mycena haematopus]
MRNCTATHDEQRRLIAEANKENIKHKVTEDGERSKKFSKNSSGSKLLSPASSSGTMNTFPRKLDVAERELLNAHQGCTRCHTAYAGHHANECTTEAPTADNYYKVTEQYCTSAKRDYEKKSNSKGTKAPNVATVVPPVVEDSDNSYDVSNELSNIE